MINRISFRYLLTVFLCYAATDLLFAQAPVNDECAGAVNIPTDGSTISTQFTNAFATASMPGCAAINNKDIWFRFKATSTRHQIKGYSLNFDYDLAVQLFSGTCTNLTSLVCSTNLSGILDMTNLIVDSTYYYRLYVANGNPVSTFFYTAVTSPGPPPANDECTGATLLSVNTGFTTALNYVTQSLPQCASTGWEAKDAWYKFVATATSHTVRVNPISFDDYVFQVYSGSCGSLTTKVCMNNTELGEKEAASLANLTIGSTYYIRVYNRYADATPNRTFTILVDNLPACINDECGAAVLVPTDGTSTGPYSNTGATLSLPGCASVADNDMWFKFKATSIRHQVKAYSSTGPQPVIQVYSGSCRNLTSLLCYTSNQGIADVTNLKLDSMYYYRLYLPNGSSLKTDINTYVTSPGPPPSNDECGGATKVGSSLTTALGYVTSSAPSCITTSYMAKDAWYYFVGSGATHTLTLNAISFDKYMLQVYTGSCNNLTSTVCKTAADLGSAIQHTISSSVANERYYFRVFNYYEDATPSRTFSLNLTNLPTLDTSAPVIDNIVYPTSVDLSAQPVNITARFSDNTGLDVSANHKPAAFVKKGSSGPFSKVEGVLQSGHENKGVWAFDFTGIAQTVTYSDTLYLFLAGQESGSNRMVSWPSGVKTGDLSNLTVKPDTFLRLLLVDKTAPAILVDSISARYDTAGFSISATILDSTGVSASQLPKVYVKNGKNGSWKKKPAVLVSGTAKNGTWLFDIDKTILGKLSYNDTLFYFMVAADASATVNYGMAKTGGIAYSVDSILTYPSLFSCLIVDSVKPVITYQPLSTAYNTGSRVLSVEITDLQSGIPLTGTATPKLHIRNGVAGNWEILNGIQQSGDTYHSIWAYTLSYTGGTKFGDTLYYLPVVQDLATVANLVSNPGTVTGTSVNTISAYPIQLPSYRMMDTLAPKAIFTPIADMYVPANPIVTLSLTDSSAVDTLKRPMLYCKKGIAGSWFSTPSSVVTYASTAAIVRFTVPVLTIGATYYDTVYYFMTARDTVGNVFLSAPGGVAVRPDSIVTFPHGHSFMILDSIPPVIVSNTSSTVYTLADCKLSHTVTDNVNVQSCKLWYAKNETGPWFSDTMTLTGTHTYEFTIATGSTLNARYGDQIFYFVLATDAGGNNASFPKGISLNANGSPTTFSIAGSILLKDTIKPVIAGYTPLPNLFSKNNTTTAVMIQDNDSVQYARLWYKSGVGGSWVSTDPVVQFNTYTFTLPLASVPNLNFRDTVYYFIASSDLSKNTTATTTGVQAISAIQITTFPDNAAYIILKDTVKPIVTEAAPIVQMYDLSDTFIHATITDNHAIHHTQLWVKKGSAMSWKALAPTMHTGAAYTFQLNVRSMLNATFGDTVCYFIAATDSSGNLESSPAGFRFHRLDSTYSYPDPHVFLLIDSIAPQALLPVVSDTNTFTTRTVLCALADNDSISLTVHHSPVLYYKKGNNSWVQSSGKLNSGTLKQGIWAFEMLASMLSGIAAGDTIYYVVAIQDRSLQLTSEPFGAVGERTDSLVLFPASPRFFTILATTGTTETLFPEKQFFAYPNPTKGIIHIGVSTPPVNNSNNCRVVVYDQLGRETQLLSSFDLITQPYLDLSSLQAGLYSVVITYDVEHIEHVQVLTVMKD